MPETIKIMLVAGEASGDAHAAKLVEALGDVRPDTEFNFFGSAGPKMRNAGVEAIVPADELAIVGIAEIAASLPMFVATFRKLRRNAIERRPDVVVLIDFPDFNLRLARSLKRLGFPIVYYISPQLWAWRQRRVRIIRDYVDRMLSILPFEKEWYTRHGVAHVEYVGSPLAREVHPTRNKAEFCESHGLDASRPLISLLPGSRRSEISTILPIMLQAGVIVHAQRHDVQFVVAAPSGREVPAIKAAIDQARDLPDTMRVAEGETFDALAASDAAGVTSGTATLEAGLLGTPMAIVYKTSALNYMILEPMIDVDHYGLINLIAGKRIAKELIQKGFTAQSLADELLDLLKPEGNAAARNELRGAAERLGYGGASKRAAMAILRLIDDGTRDDQRPLE